MRKIMIGAAMVAVLVVPATALAQNPAPVVSVDAKAAKHKFSFKVVNSAASKTTVKQIKLELPKGVKLSGKKLTSCTADDYLANGKCPSASKLGKGVAYAFIVAPTAAPDCVGTNGAAPGCLTFDTAFFVGGKNALTVTLTQRGGGSFPPLTGKITAGGRKLTIDLPADLQQPAPGSYSALLQLSGTFNKGSFVTTTKTSGVAKATLTYAANAAPAPAPASGKDSVK